MIKVFLTVLAMAVFFISVSASFNGVQADGDGKGPWNKGPGQYRLYPDISNQHKP
jgi:hypothetical protein